MHKLTLRSEQIAKLKIVHRRTKKKRDADRIKAIVLLSQGWTFVQVAQALLIDEETIRNYLKCYKAKGVKGLLKNNFKGTESKLSKKELRQLDKRLQNETYLTVQEIVLYVKATFKIKYSISGMTELLHRMSYVYKKPKVVPGKADLEAQKSFINSYKKLKSKKGENDPIYFMDGTHPQHNTVAAYGWIKKGTDKTIKSNSGRQRLNINGAINIEKIKMSVHYADSINAQSTIALFKKVERANKKANKIYLIADNARYYKSKLVKEYLKHSKVKLVFLPAYSPNLNLIERLWKHFRKTVLYNKYYKSFDEFKLICKNFFKNIKKYRKELASLLKDNFQLFDAKKPKTCS
jgi:transposase